MFFFLHRMILPHLNSIWNTRESQPPPVCSLPLAKEIAKEGKYSAFFRKRVPAARLPENVSKLLPLLRWEQRDSKLGRFHRFSMIFVVQFVPKLFFQKFSSQHGKCWRARSVSLPNMCHFWRANCNSWTESSTSKVKRWDGRNSWTTSSRSVLSSESNGLLTYKQKIVLVLVKELQSLF